MIEIINKVISNKMVGLVGVWYGLPITIALIIFFFVKSSRDERDRKSSERQASFLRLHLLFSSTFLQNYRHT